MEVEFTHVYHEFKLAGDLGRRREGHDVPDISGTQRFQHALHIDEF